MRITSVILHFGALSDTAEAVQSILASTVSSDVLVVNNDVPGAIDPIDLTLADTANGDRVQVIDAGRNRGFAAGMNLGIRASLDHGADAVFLLNNDAVVAVDSLARLREAAEEHADFGILAPVVYYAAHPDRVWSAGWRQRPFLGLLEPLSPPDPAIKVSEAPVVAGCAMFIRRSTIERVGLFDERFFLYYEDVDLCQRAWSAGVRVGVVPRAGAYHKVSEQPRLLERSRVYAWARSKALCYGRAPGMVGSLLASFRLSAGILSFALRCARVGHFDSIPLYVKGTRDGWRVARAG